MICGAKWDEIQCCPISIKSENFGVSSQCALYGPDFPSFFHNSLPFIELTCHSHYNFFVQLVSKWNGSGCFSMIRKELSLSFLSNSILNGGRDPLSRMKKLFNERNFYY